MVTHLSCDTHTAVAYANQILLSCVWVPHLHEGLDRVSVRDHDHNGDGLGGQGKLPLLNSTIERKISLQGSLNGLGVGHLKLWPIFNPTVIVTKVANMNGLLGLGEVFLLKGPKLIVPTALSDGELIYFGFMIVTSYLHLRELLSNVDLDGL